MQAPNQGHLPPMLTPDVSRRWQMLALVAVIGFLIWLLAPVLMPFAIAAMLAYLGDPLADRLQRLGMGRTMAVSIVFSVIGAAILRAQILRKAHPLKRLFSFERLRPAQGSARSIAG